MPVTTRSKDYNLDSLPSDINGIEPHSSRLASKKRTVTSPKIVKIARHSTIRKQQPSRAQSPSNQNQNRTKPSFTAPENPQLNPGDNTLDHWPCGRCSCPQGIFKPLIDACVHCGHDMNSHRDEEHPWDPGCDYVCERRELVTSILQMVESNRVLIIRATPQVGKTTLLLLLGHHILTKRPDLEPVFVYWLRRQSRDTLSYQTYLKQEKSLWQERNAKRRPHKEDARTVYLIDEAQGSYEEESFWNTDLKGKDTRSRPLFILICLYGATGLSQLREPNVQSQASQVDAFQRIELRPAIPGQPQLLFRLKESTTVITKWATQNRFTLEDGVFDYLHAATDGHPGALGLTLRYFDHLFKV